MRRQIIGVFLSLLCLALPSAFGADRGALFKVAANGHTMYLFGTIHVGQAGFYPLEPRIASAVAGASTLALEIDPGQDPAVMAQALQAHGMHAPGSAKPKMTPGFKARLKKLFTRSGIQPEAMEPLKPWLVATVLAIAEYSSLGYRTDLGVDAHLAQLARDNKVRVMALESPGSQMSLFNRMSDTQQLAFLEESVTLIESGKQKAEVRQIVDAWGTADKRVFDDIAERLARDTSFSGKFLKNVLLDERNIAIADKLAALLKRESNTVAAVGVLHLVGSNSVPALLGARGLSVERVY